MPAAHIADTSGAVQGTYCSGGGGSSTTPERAPPRPARGASYPSGWASATINQFYCDASQFHFHWIGRLRAPQLGVHYRAPCRLCCATFMAAGSAKSLSGS